MSIIQELLVTFIILLIGGEVTNGSETKLCPAYCTCDLFENFNRADCSRQRLITPNVEVPSAVELLDISYNDITTLDNTCFEGLIYVINLTIAYNALHTIYLEAFSPLKEIKSIDLSYNRLEYFDERIFETNSKLTRLDLSGNKFMSVQNKPFLKSTSIRYLGLQDAQVTYIYPLMFTEMPNLREIDISNNLMITLTSNAFSTLHQLEAMNLEQNHWVCDKALDSTLQCLRERGIETKLSACAMFELKRTHSIGVPHMFERMMVEHSIESTSPSSPKESISIKDIWKPKKPIDLELEDEASCELESPTKVCQLYRNCLTNNRILTDQKVDPREQYTINDLHFVFLTGVSLGAAVVTWFVTCWICVRRCLDTQAKLTQRRAARAAANPIPFRRPIPPPIPPRQRRSNRRSVNPPQLNRSLSSPVRRGAGNQSDFATFVSRFFERPSRHQYYRTINENAGRLIRRLSQTNLSNRLSQHFTGGRNGDGEHVQNAEPIIDPLQTAEGQSVYPVENLSRLPIVHIAPGGINRPTPSLSCIRFVPSSQTNRPETPPPSYVDIMNPKVDV